MLKKNLKNAFIFFKGHEVIRFFNKSPKVIFWHGVDNDFDLSLRPENIDVSTFIEQIKYLKKHFEIISMDEFYQRYNLDNFSGKEIVLTFDDGYRNNLTVLAPIMNEFSLPFTTFISTENISNNEFFPTSLARIIILGSSLKSVDIPNLKIKREIVTKEQKKNVEKEISSLIKSLPINDVRKLCEDLKNNISNEEFEEIGSKYYSIIPMNWGDVKKLQESGCEIGSHCMDHICCHENQQKEEVERQIIESKKIIEEKLGKECKYFAYPNGDFTDFSNECVKKAGYKMGFSTSKGNMAMESYLRFGVQYNMDTFKIMLNLYGLIK